jgi:hypothetical protein
MAGDPEEMAGLRELDIARVETEEGADWRLETRGEADADVSAPGVGCNRGALRRGQAA